MPLISACYPTITPAPKTYEYEEPKQMPVCNTAAALTLIQNGANVNGKDDMGRSSLHWICKMQEELDEAHRAVFKTLLDHSPDLMHQQDTQGFNLSQPAISNRHTHLWITSYLINYGADPKEPDPVGNTTLNYLTPQLHSEKTKLKSETPLFRFIFTSWEGAVDYTGTYSSPAYAIENDISHLKALTLFLDAGADLQTSNKEGGTLLHFTVKRWRKKQYVEGDQRDDVLGIFKELLARGLDPRVEDEMCRTAIDVADASGKLFLVELFGQEEKGIAEHEKGVEDIMSES